MKQFIFIFIFLIVPSFIWGQDGVKPIIDMHLHDYNKQSYHVSPAPDGTTSPSTYEQYRREVFAMLKKYNVVHAVVSTMGGENKLDDQGILIPGFHLNEPGIDTLTFKNLIETGKLKVFGEIGAMYVGKTLSDPEYEPYLDICERYNIPVAIHTGGGPTNITSIRPNFRLKKGDPFTIEDVLVKHPNLKIYLMHAGVFYYEHALVLMQTYPNVYADLGVILWYDNLVMDYAGRFLRKAKEYDLLDRVMYGSDQMVWPHAIEKSIKQLNSYEFLTEKDKRKIFYENAVRFLSLK